MSRIALRTEECCSWCKRPVNCYAEPSCDDAPTYTGMLLRGGWHDLEAGRTPTPLARHAATPALTAQA